jgi:hypothetical protein
MSNFQQRMMHRWRWMLLLMLSRTALTSIELGRLQEAPPPMSNFPLSTRHILKRLQHPKL